MRPFLRRALLRRLACECSGAAMAEFALVAPVLAAMLLGMIDFSLWTMSRMSVERAARAGAEYAVAKGFDSTQIASAITSATSTRSAYMSTISATPAPTEWCGCPSSSGVTVATCGSTCSSGLTAGTYVTAHASSNYTFFFSWPGVANPATLSASTSVRIN
jgi:Flp pilus assembly protein TadG